jgi:hypothetical protein
MTFTRKDRSARRAARPAHRAARKTEQHLAPISGDDTTDAMRSVVAHTSTGWNALRHAC